MHQNYIAHEGKAMYYRGCTHLCPLAIFKIQYGRQTPQKSLIIHYVFMLDN